MRLRVLLALFVLVPIAQAFAEGSDSFYLERRNDLGLVAYCSEHGMLPDDSYRYFKAGMDEIFGQTRNTPEGDLHERKGREGRAYLQGEEQSIEDLAAANEVDVAEVCDQYKVHISLGKVIAHRPAP